jgi:hypothetical protein
MATQKGARKMKKVFVEISEDLHAQLKSIAALKRTTLKELIESGLDEIARRDGKDKK